MVLHWEWSQDVKDLYHLKTITNSDIKMAGLLFLWLVMETACDDLQEKKGGIIQQQLTHCWMGLLSCITWVPGICAPHLCTCPPAKTERDMPHNPTPHRGQGELDDGHPLALVWKQTKVALQI
jgi:hypothetical protein